MSTDWKTRFKKYLFAAEIHKVLRDLWDTMYILYTAIQYKAMQTIPGQRMYS